MTHQLTGIVPDSRANNTQEDEKLPDSKVRVDAFAIAFKHQWTGSRFRKKRQTD